MRARIATAARDAGRDPRDITLIAVTKFFPASDVDLLAAHGVSDVGESRDQEARAKRAQVVAGGLRWHFVGRLQRNKAASVGSWAAAVHSVDRVELVAALGSGARRAAHRVDVFVQVSLDGAPGRGGVALAGLLSVAQAVAADPHTRLRGVMAVAPQSLPAEQAFGLLGEAAAGLRERYPDADAISAGMSGDFEAAIAQGATHLRVGSALLGRRPPIVS